jgi:hypothetical protein
VSRPRATLRILDVPKLGRDARRFEVDCRYATTGLTQVPVPSSRLSDEVLILAAGWAHEERCGRCDVGDVLGRGDQELRAQTEFAVLAGRRN